MENKKTLILSIIGILVLVIAVVGVSFAMYTFSGTGTKKNTITTGSISVDIAGAAFNFDGKYPMSDAKGMEATDNIQTVTVSSNWPAGTPVEVEYDLGLEVVQATGTLTANFVKVLVKDEGGNVLVGGGKGSTTATGGTLISDLASTEAENGLITTYGIAGGSFVEGGATDTYTVQAWVANNYVLPVDTANTTSPEDDNGTLDNANGTLHQKQTAANTFKFKVIMKASQV